MCPYKAKKAETADVGAGGEEEGGGGGGGRGSRSKMRCRRRWWRSSIGASTGDLKRSKREQNVRTHMREHIYAHAEYRYAHAHTLS